MRIKRLVGGLLALSMVISALPARAESETGLEPTASTAAPSTFSRASLDRAAATVALVPEGQKGLESGRAPRALKRSESAPEAAAGQASGGGGGRGVATLIITLVGTAAGIGATVYMLKQVKKAQGVVVTP